MPEFRAGCPGQDTAYLKDFKTNIVPCPGCGHEIEFFSDEKKIKCPECHRAVFKVDPGVIEYKNGRLTFKGEDKNCLDWCGGCLSAEDYRDIKKNKKRIEKKKKDFKRLIDSIDKKDRDVIYFLIEAFQKSINNTKLIDEKIFQILQKENPELFIKVRNYYLNFIKG